MRPMEPPHGRLGPMKEHLCVHKVPVQINEPMEEPEEAGTEARSPSPEYGDPISQKFSWRRPKKPEPEPEAPAQST